MFLKDFKAYGENLEAGDNVNQAKSEFIGICSIKKTKNIPEEAGFDI